MGYIHSNAAVNLYIVALIVFQAYQPVLAFQPNQIVRIAQTEITIPIPEGFSSPSENSRRLIQRGELSTITEDRLLLMFAKPDDIKAEEDGRNALMDRYMLVQTTRAIEPHTLNQIQFQNYRNQVRRELSSQFVTLLPDVQKNWDRYANEMARQGRGNPDMKIVDIGPVGLFFEDLTAVGVSGVVYSDVYRGGTKRAHFTAWATTLILVKGKLLWLHSLLHIPFI